MKPSDRRMTAEFTTQSPEQTQALGRLLGGLLRQPTVIGLSGPLGAGKTLLAQGITAGVGVSGYVKSPSFTLVHLYRGRMPVYHLDVYRLDDPGEIEDLGFDEMQNEGSIVIVEWADRVERYMPPERIDVSILRNASGALSRSVRVTGYGDGPMRVVESLAGGPPS